MEKKSIFKFLEKGAKKRQVQQAKFEAEKKKEEDKVEKVQEKSAEEIAKFRNSKRKGGNFTDRFGVN